MEQKVCLDTDACIEILKDTPKGRKLLLAIEQSEVYLSTITVFELFLRRTNLLPIESLVGKTTILDFDELSARKAAEQFKTLQQAGKPVDLRDVFIASTALMHQCALATFNRRHFWDMEGLRLIS